MEAKKMNWSLFGVFIITSILFLVYLALILGRLLESYYQRHYDWNADWSKWRKIGFWAGVVFELTFTIGFTAALFYVLVYCPLMDVLGPPCSHSLDDSTSSRYD
jgi:ABC-type Fe3+ transport system permease subunit